MRQDGVDYDVVWDGGELLPERESSYDTRWDGIPYFSFGEEEVCEPVRPKRRYNKSKLEYWNNRASAPEVTTREAGDSIFFTPRHAWKCKRPSVPEVQPSGADPAGEGETETTG